MIATTQVLLFADEARLKTENTLDAETRQSLVASCPKLAYKLAHTLSARLGLNDTDREDACGEATVALCEAARFYDPERGSKFSTYATGYVSQWLQRWVSEMAEGPALASLPAEDLLPGGGGESGEEIDVDEPDEDDAALLRNLSAIAREVVRLTVFERADVSRIAERLNIAEKDVRLIQRNAAKKLSRIDTDVFANGLMAHVGE